MHGGTSGTAADIVAQKQRLADAAVNYFDPAFIALCGASYATPGLICGDVASVPSWDGTGRWKCVWGPALDPDQANLAFVAAYLANGSDLPICAAVVLRGTDATQTWGDFIEAVEDLDVGTPVPFPQADDSSVQVAPGTLIGLGIIQALSDPTTGQALPDFIAGYCSDPANENPVLVVTGHSLGGCLATVVAPWATTLVPATVPVKAVTFAAPTAGNPAFAEWYAKTVRISTGYYNSLDIIPMAWANLPGILASFPGGPSIPIVEQLAVEFWMNDVIDGLTYAQPVPRGELDGTICGGQSWYDEMFSQHNHLTYISLMAGGGSVCGVTRHAFRSLAATGDARLVKG